MEFSSVAEFSQNLCFLPFNWNQIVVPSISQEKISAYQNLLIQYEELARKNQELTRENLKLKMKVNKNKPKRHYSERRTDLKKQFQCQIEGCNHKYSSRIALNLHLKKKHREVKNFQQ